MSDQWELKIHPIKIRTGSDSISQKPFQRRLSSAVAGAEGSLVNIFSLDLLLDFSSPRFLLERSVMMKAFASGVLDRVKIRQPLCE